MDLGIKGMRVLVTGAGRGLGRAAALDFAREGCRVAAVSRDPRRLESLMAEMGGTAAGHASQALDLLEPGAPARTLDGFEPGGGFDIALHNLGGTLEVKDPLAPLEAWARVWQFNVGVAIELNGRLLPAMAGRGYGRIIHVSSISAESVRGSTPYAAAKAYLNAYTRGVGRSFAARGVVVSAVMPGAFQDEGGPWDRRDPALVADFLRHHQAIGRLGAPREITPFLLFLASRHAGFAPAAVLPVDGGTM